MAKKAADEMKEVPEKVEDIAVDVKDKVVETAEDVKEKVEEVVGKIGDTVKGNIKFEEKTDGSKTKIGLTETIRVETP